VLVSEPSLRGRTRVTSADRLAPAEPGRFVGKSRLGFSFGGIEAPAGVAGFGRRGLELNEFGRKMVERGGDRRATLGRRQAGAASLIDADALLRFHRREVWRIGFVLITFASDRPPGVGTRDRSAGGAGFLTKPVTPPQPRHSHSS